MQNNIHINFAVRDLSIRLIDNIHIPAGNRNFIRARFEMSASWDGLDGIAIFARDDIGVLHMPLENRACAIPNELMAEPGRIDVSIFAGDRRTVNAAQIRIIESGYRNENPPKPIEPPAPPGGGDISQIFRDILALQSEVAALQSVDGNLLQLISDLQYQIDNPADVDFSSIMADILALQSGLSDLKGVVDTAISDFADLQFKVTALAELIGDGYDIDLSGILSDIRALQNDLSAAENNLSAEIANREQAISDKQAQIDNLNTALGNGLTMLNNAIIETNRIVGGGVTRTAQGVILNSIPLKITEVAISAFPVLNPPIEFIQGATLINGDNDSGTWGVYIGHKDADTIYVQTKTTAGGNLGLARTAYFNDQIQITNGMAAFITDTGIMLKDGANYEVWVSALEGNSGASVSSGNGITLYMFDGNAYTPFGQLPNSNAILNAEWRFRWQMHPNIAQPGFNNVNAFPRHGGGVIIDMVYTSSANIGVDYAGLARTTAQATAAIQRISLPDAAKPTLAFGVANTPSANIRFMVKIIEQQSAFPTN
ncbi:MAG: hypothetical protein FWB71_04720 [Defluviitaleaceae bacterium]|nr:hypothetical protein [Defluviitaleaceae bacterium]